MFSASEIEETFKLMGLFTYEERERFHTMSVSEARSEQQRTHVFIGASGNSVQLESEEVTDAGLETNS